METVIIPSKYKSDPNSSKGISEPPKESKKTVHNIAVQANIMPTVVPKEIIIDNLPVAKIENYNFIIFSIIIAFLCIIAFFIWFEYKKSKENKQFKPVQYSRNKKEFYNSIPMIYTGGEPKEINIIIEREREKEREREREREREMEREREVSLEKEKELINKIAHETIIPQQNVKKKLYPEDPAILF